MARGLLVLALLLLTVKASGQCGLIAEFQAPNPQPGDMYGGNVAMDGDVAVIGTFDAAAYVYRWDGASWNLESELLPSDGAPGRFFAESVAISGDVIVIGAGEWTDDALGAVYVYHYVDGIWDEEAILMASDGTPRDLFGIRVVMEDDLIVVWSSDYENTEGFGALYMFRDHDGGWIEEAKLMLGLTDWDFGAFWRSFTINQGRLVVYQALGREIAIYQQLDGTWGETDRITLVSRLDDRVRSVAMHNDDLVISSSPMVDGIPNDGISTYKWDGTQWQFKGSQHLPSNRYSGLALSGDVLVVSHTQNYFQRCEPGVVYFYRRADDHWVPVRKYMTPDGMPGDRLGSHLETNGKVVFASTSRGDSNYDSPGAAFLFSLEGPQFDCNANLIEDACEIAIGSEDDCNANGVPDTCDVAQGIENDRNLDGVLDSCQPVRGIIPSLIDQFTGDDPWTFWNQGNPSVAISSDVAVIGDEIKVRVLRRNGIVWTEEAILRGDEMESSDRLGLSVATNGQVILVGRPFQSEPGGVRGVVYIYRYEAVTSEWKQEAKLEGGIMSPSDEFGFSVAISGETIVIGAQSFFGLNAGSAYVYRYEDSQWISEAVLPSPRGHRGDKFGSAVDIDGDTIVIGAPLGGDYRRFQDGSGAAYVFQRESGEWGFQRELKSIASTERILGFDVAIDGDRILAGVPIVLAGCARWGAVAIFERTGGEWPRIETLNAPFPGAGAFGMALDLSGDMALIGARSENSASSTGGAAYLYQLGESGAVFLSRLANPDPESQQAFGEHVALDGTYGLIDAHGLNVDRKTYLFAGFAQDDCNSNGESDIFEIDGGTIVDRNRNGIPDECERPGDSNRRRQFGVTDLLDLLAVWGSCPAPCPWDFNHDGQVNVTDLLNLLRRWR